MVVSCWALGCSNRLKEGSYLKFYRFPLSNPIRVTLWLNAIQRWCGPGQTTTRSDGFLEPSAYARICSAHFVSGAPSSDVTSVDYCPSIFNSTASSSKKNRVDRRGRVKKFDPFERGFHSDKSCEKQTQTVIEMRQTMKTFDVERVKILQENYLRLYWKIQQLKELASIDLDLLSLGVDVCRVPEAKDELDKVHELVQALLAEEEALLAVDVFYHGEDSKLSRREESCTSTGMEAQTSGGVETQTSSSNYQSISHNRLIADDARSQSLDRLLAEITFLYTREEIGAAQGRLLHESLYSFFKDFYKAQDRNQWHWSPVIKQEFVDNNNSDTDSQDEVVSLPDECGDDGYVYDHERFPHIQNVFSCHQETGDNVFSDDLDVPKVKIELNSSDDDMQQGEDFFSSSDSQRYVPGPGEKSSPGVLKKIRDFVMDRLSSNSQQPLRSHQSFSSQQPLSSQETSGKGKSSARKQPVVPTSFQQQPIMDKKGCVQARNLHKRDHGGSMLPKPEIKLTSCTYAQRPSKPFECEFCDEKFGLKTYLVKHCQREHPHFIPHSCTICNKTLSNRSNLTRHMRIYHDDEKRYPSSDCGKAFSSNNSQNYREESHTEQMSYQCPFCPRQFFVSDQLHNHVSQHMEEVDEG